MSTTTTTEPLLPDAIPADLARRVEWAAQAIVMLDNRDLPALAKLAKGLREIGAGYASLALSAAGPVESSSDAPEETAVAAENERKAIIAAADRLEGIILETSGDPAADLDAVGETIAALQISLCRGRPPARGGGTGGGLAPTGSADTKPPPGGDPEAAAGRGMPGRRRTDVIDDELFAAFIAQQQSVLPDIDEAILAYEKDGAPEQLAALRRIIHTMKGEAGVCGVSDIATACHQVEDYLEIGAPTAGKQGVSADVLFAFKDWLEKAIASCGAGETPEGLGDLLSEKAGSPPAKAAEPAAAPPPAAAALPDATPIPVAVAPPAPASSGPAPAATVPIGDRELAGDFVGEAQEHFDSADENLLRLESDPGNKDAIGAVFRAFHTIKGVSGFIGLAPIGELAHVAETLLDDVRKGRHAFRGPVVDVTFRALDMLKQMLMDLGAALKSGRDLSVRGELAPLLAQLQAVRNGVEIAVAPDQGETGVPGEPRGGKSARRPGSAGGESGPAENEPGTDGQSESAGKASTLVKPTMKVETEKIDLLLDTIGELVITETIVAEDPDIKGLRSHHVEKTLAQLGKITRSLQDMSMAMRMVPVEATFRKMARLVRDLAIKSGKHVEFAMEGQETEIDKGMIEKLGDPLVHMVRNSVDHGLEPAAERVARGKSEAGHVTLRAFHHGGSIHIQIVDDGRGLDRAAIVAKAIEKGLLASGEALADDEVFALIFEPGFSTAKQVTEVSGRGVGMDVVRRNVEAMRGKVLIQTTPGQGSVFTIVLPLTMAIIDGMQVRVGTEVFVIPTLSIVEVFRPAPGTISTVQGKGELILFRDALLPLHRVAELFNVTSAGAGTDAQLVVVVEDSGRRTGFVVEELLGQQQTVIKNLGAAMGTVPGISGASIMADGRPGLIVDVSGVVKLAREAA